jgi:hypothetical protein
VRLGHVALDGTKVKANASKHKAMSYDRMKKDEARLKDKVDQLLAQAEQADAEEDTRYGRTSRGDELPEDLRRSKDRLQRIRELKAALEAEAREQRSHGDDSDDDDPGAPCDTLPTHKIPVQADGKPTDKAQRNFTDPDSRIMKTGDGFVQGYNCQLVVDADHQIIVAQQLSNQPPDVEYLQPLVEQTIRNCGQAPRQVSADAGYFSEANPRLPPLPAADHGEGARRVGADRPHPQLAEAASGDRVVPTDVGGEAAGVGGGGAPAGPPSPPPA